MNTNYTKAQQRLLRTIRDMEMELGELPALDQLCNKMSLPPQSITRSLILMDFDYPIEKMITPLQRRMIDTYKEGMGVSELAGLLDIHPSLVYQNLDRIKACGYKMCWVDAKKYNVGYREKYGRKTKDLPVVSVRVKDGKYKGLYGYIDESCLVVVHVEGKPVKIDLFPYQYEVIEKRKK